MAKKQQDPEENFPDGKGSVYMPDDLLKGTYSNHLFIQNNAHEFLFDFSIYDPYSEKTVVTNRIFMTPASAKKALIALYGAIQEYESLIGEINLENFPGEEQEERELTQTPTKEKIS